MRWNRAREVYGVARADEVCNLRATCSTAVGGALRAARTTTERCDALKVPGQPRVAGADADGGMGVCS